MSEPSAMPLHWLEWYLHVTSYETLINDGIAFRAILRYSADPIRLLYPEEAPMEFGL